MRNVIVSIDGSSSSNAAFRWGSENFFRPDDHVILLHITKDFRSLDLEPGAVGSGKDIPAEVLHAYEQKVEQQARMLTSQYTNQLLAGNIKHEAVIAKGDPRQLILEYADRYQPVAIIMGSRGLGLLKRSFLGSVSDYILHNSEFPVIVVREPSEAKSGKSSIQKVVFKQLSPNETLFLESTSRIERDNVYHSAYVQFEIWDFPGQAELFDASGAVTASTGTTAGTSSSGAPSPAPASVNVAGLGAVDVQDILGGVGVLVFVIDAQDDYIESLSKLYTTVTRVHKLNPNMAFEVFIHKVDGLSDEHKIETQRDIQQRITDELADSGLENIHLSFYLTSIYDHSIYEAFSKVIQKLIPQLPTLENLLNVLCSNSGIEKAFLFDVLSKIYIATDSSPVDMTTYELCSDMIDVVVDVSCIYGQYQQPPPSPLANAQAPAITASGHQTTAGTSHSPPPRKSTLSRRSPSPTASNLPPIPYDAHSTAHIQLTNGTVLHLREVGPYLALVCLMRADAMRERGGLIEFNFGAFREAVERVFALRRK